MAMIWVIVALLVSKQEVPRSQKGCFLYVEILMFICF